MGLFHVVKVSASINLYDHAFFIVNNWYYHIYSSLSEYPNSQALQSVYSQICKFL